MWLNPPDNLILGEEEAHIWCADLNCNQRFQNSFLKLLSPDENNRAEKFRFAKDRLKFILARGILRSLIGKYLSINPAEVSFHYSEFGKPGIADNHSQQIEILKQ